MSRRILALWAWFKIVPVILSHGWIPELIEGFLSVTFNVKNSGHYFVSADVVPIHNLELSSLDDFQTKPSWSMPLRSESQVLAPAVCISLTGIWVGLPKQQSFLWGDVSLLCNCKSCRKCHPIGIFTFISTSVHSLLWCHWLPKPYTNTVFVSSK